MMFSGKTKQIITFWDMENWNKMAGGCTEVREERIAI